MTSEKKAKKLSGREKKLFGVRRVRAFAPSFSLSFSQLREEKRVMVSQSISVFFLLKNQEAFFRNEGRPLAREKSPLVNERSSFQFFSVVRYFFLSSLTSIEKRGSAPLYYSYSYSYS